MCRNLRLDAHICAIIQWLLPSTRVLNIMCIRTLLIVDMRVIFLGKDAHRRDMYVSISRFFFLSKKGVNAGCRRKKIRLQFIPTMELWQCSMIVITSSRLWVKKWKYSKKSSQGADFHFYYLS